MTHIVKTRVGGPLRFEILQNNDFGRCSFNGETQTVWCHWSVLNMKNGGILDAMIACPPGKAQEFCFSLEECDYFISLTRYTKPNPKLLDSPIDASHLHIEFDYDDGNSEFIGLDEAFWKGRQDLDSDEGAPKPTGMIPINDKGKEEL